MVKLIYKDTGSILDSSTVCENLERNEARDLMEV